MIKEYDQRITDQACEDAASYKTYKIVSGVLVLLQAAITLSLRCYMVYKWQLFLSTLLS